jgi:hypothetical protein
VATGRAAAENFRMFSIPNGMKPVGNPAPNLPNLMQRLPLRSDHQRLRVACSEMPPGKRGRLGPPNPHPKIMKFSNQLGDFLNALKQSLFTTAITHKRHLTKPEVQFSAKTCTRDLNFPTPEEYGSTKGECGKPLRQRPRLDPRLDLAELAVALKAKSLARNRKPQSPGSGSWMMRATCAAMSRSDYSPHSTDFVMPSISECEPTHTPVG